MAVIERARRLWHGVWGDVGLGATVLAGAVGSFSSGYYLAPITATVFLGVCLFVRAFGHVYWIRNGRRERWRNAAIDMFFVLATPAGPVLGMGILRWRLRLEIGAYDGVVANVAEEHDHELRSAHDTGVLPMPEYGADLGRSIRVVKGADGQVSAHISLKGDARYGLRLAGSEIESRVLAGCGKQLSDRWYLVVGPCGGFGRARRDDSSL
jgi:hypothetical protein